MLRAAHNLSRRRNWFKFHQHRGVSARRHGSERIDGQRLAKDRKDEISKRRWPSLVVAVTSARSMTPLPEQNSFVPLSHHPPAVRSAKVAALLLREAQTPYIAPLTGCVPASTKMASESAWPSHSRPR